LKAAYVDTSSVLAVYLLEPGHRRVRDALDEYDEILSSNLLEAEIRSAMLREGLESPDLELLERLVWVFPSRPLSEELSTVLSAGYLRGADLWHLACALYLRGPHNEVEFLTLDRRQLKVAERLGFRSV